MTGVIKRHLVLEVRALIKVDGAIILLRICGSYEIIHKTSGASFPTFFDLSLLSNDKF